MAMEGGGNYRARLAARNYQSRSDQAFSTPPPKDEHYTRGGGVPSPIGLAYSQGFNYLGDFIKDFHLGGVLSIPTMAENKDYKGIALAVGSAGLGAGGRGRAARGAGKVTLNTLNSRDVSRLVDLARLRAQGMLGDTAEEYARMGMRMPDYSQQVSKAPDVVYDFLEQMIATGAKPRTINRWLKFAQDFDEDAVDALERYGYGTSLWGAPARGAERLYERLMRRVESSVDQF